MKSHLWTFVAALGTGLPSLTLAQTLTSTAVVSRDGLEMCSEEGTDNAIADCLDSVPAACGGSGYAFDGTAVANAAYGRVSLALSGAAHGKRHGHDYPSDNIVEGSAIFQDSLMAIGGTGSATVTITMVATVSMSPGTIMNASTRYTIAGASDRHEFGWTEINGALPPLTATVQTAFGSTFPVTMSVGRQLDCCPIMNVRSDCPWSPQSMAASITWEITEVQVRDSSNQIVPHAVVRGVSGTQYLGPPPPAHVHVTPDAPLVALGQDWSNPASLWWALEQARLPATPVREIWLAEGRYTPDKGIGVTPGDREASFDIRTGVAVLGGFAGNETDSSQRDPAGRRSILSGDLAGDDDPADLDGFLNRSDNAYNVATVIGTSNTATLDGVTVSGGYAHGPSCVSHPCSRLGGGVSVAPYATPTFINTLFEHNSAADRGGAVILWNASGRFEDCVFRNNRSSSGDGHAVYLANPQTPVEFTVCMFEDHASASGPAVKRSLGATCFFRECSFRRNNQGLSGDYFVIEDCEFSENGGNGAIAGAGLTVARSMFHSNLAEQGGAIYVSDTDTQTTTIERCEFYDNTATYNGGAIFAAGVLLEIADCRFERNETLSPSGSRGGGGVYLWNGTIKRCVFRDNTSAYNGDALMLIDNTEVHDCDLRMTTGGGWSALYIAGSGNLVTNCLIAGHKVGIYLVGPNTDIVNCTIADFNSYGIAQFGASNSRLRNSILVGTGSVFHPNGLTPSITHSNVGVPVPGLGNISADPRFAGPASPGFEYTLAADSPCIDAGDNTAIPTGIALDLAGLPRRADVPWATDMGVGGPPTVDMGAYERTPSASETPCNMADLATPFGLLDLSDILAFAGMADLTDPTGIDAFVTTFLGGCPFGLASSP